VAQIVGDSILRDGGVAIVAPECETSDLRQDFGEYDHVCLKMVTVTVILDSQVAKIWHVRGREELVSDRNECRKIFLPDRLEPSRLRQDSNGDAVAECDTTKVRESKVDVGRVETQQVDLAVGAFEM